MGSKYTKVLLVLLFVLLTKSFLCAQYIYPFYEGWGIGANIGLNYFYGDVNDDKGRIWSNPPLSGFYYTDKNVMGSLSLGKDISEIWGVRSHFTFGSLSGSNEKTRMYFKGDLYSFGLDVTFQYIDYFLKRPKSRKFKYYAFCGLGLTSFNSTRTETLIDMPLNAEDYNNTEETGNYITTIKLGLAIVYQLDKKWLFNFETSLNYLNTDYLDAYSSSSAKLEGYGYMSLGLVYKFDLDIRAGRNDLWKKSSGHNNRSHNSGLSNKRKRKLRNKWIKRGRMRRR